MLVEGGDAGRWIEAALRRLAEIESAVPDLSADQITGLHEHLDQIWQHAHTIDPRSERDLSQERYWDRARGSPQAPWPACTACHVSGTRLDRLHGSRESSC